jgi:hypothetical protein
MVKHNAMVPEFPFLVIVLAIGIFVTLIIARMKLNQFAFFPK